MPQELPSIEYLKECFEIRNNELYWKERPESHFPSKGLCKQVNSLVSGKRAGGKHGGGYLKVSLDGRRYFVHRVMYAMYHGRWPEGVVDHISGDPSNNSRDNLRDVTDSINRRNSKKYKLNKSGVTGVKPAASGKWYARIQFNYEEIHLGTFDTIEEAAAARKQKQLELGFTAHHGT